MGIISYFWIKPNCLMKNTTFNSLYLVLLIFSLANTCAVYSQGALIEIPLDQQIEKSELIIEGKVVAKESFWNLEKTNIYTKNIVEVYKIFKGNCGERIEIITKGGLVGNQLEHVTPSLQIQENSIGLFLLYPSKIKFSIGEIGPDRYTAYSGPQGFYKYNVKLDQATNTFNEFDGIESVFYKVITTKTQVKYREIVKKKYARNVEFKTASISKVTPVITDFNPKTIPAGAKQVLTIDGTGFGTIKGKVRFSDANEDFSISNLIEALDSQVTWSDTQILVEVPSYFMGGSSFVAGSGWLQVENSDLETDFGPALIEIPYAEINFESGGIAYQTQHVDDPETDGTGGYTWQMNTAFEVNTPAKESFMRAFDTWRCETGVNWDIGTSIPLGTANRDLINIITFDSGDAMAGGLEAGVLGVCTTYASTCSEFGTIFFVDELDIVFDDGQTWQYGPTLAGMGEIDFESVAVHELGHGHQLTHIIDNTAIMHRSLGNGDNRRVLSANDIDGANDVHLRSTTNNVGCSMNLMTNHSCSLGIEKDELFSNVKIFPNPNKGLFYIQKTASINLEKADIYDVSGRLVATYDLSDVSNLKTISLHSVSSGLYFAKVQSDQGSVTKRIVLE